MNLPSPYLRHGIMFAVGLTGAGVVWVVGGGFLGDEMNEWQPIETAPKDATPILIFLPHSERQKVCEVWWAIPYEGAADGWWSTPVGPSGRGYTILPEAATHWMPLPEPPQ